LHLSPGLVSFVVDIAVRIQRGGGKWPYETPATIPIDLRSNGKGAKSIRPTAGLRDVTKRFR